MVIHRIMITERIRTLYSASLLQFLLLQVLQPPQDHPGEIAEMMTETGMATAVVRGFYGIPFLHSAIHRHASYPESYFFSLFIALYGYPHLSGSKLALDA